MYQNEANERTLRSLAASEERVYVYLADGQTVERFIADAEREGFIYGDGARPSERVPDEIMAIHADKKMNYVGFVGRIAFGAAPPYLLRVDYRRYADGEADYLTPPKNGARANH